MTGAACGSCHTLHQRQAAGGGGGEGGNGGGGSWQWNAGVGGEGTGGGVQDYACSLFTTHKHTQAHNC
jgi:hypothetical protein